MAHNLNFAKKLLMGTAAVAAPILIGVMQTPRLEAQSLPETRLAFEVASIKLNKSEGPGKFGVAVHPGGKLTAVGTPVYMLIANAYNVSFQSPRLAGGPQWIRSERYDIEAAAERLAIPSDMPPRQQRDRLRLMLQTLLADRFKLVIRRETREIPVYTLVVAKNGPKLQKSTLEDKDCADEFGNGGVRCHAFSGGMGRGLDGTAVNMADMVAFVENWADRPLLDKTGIQGLFDIKTEGWVPLIPRPVTPGGNDEGFSDPTRPTLYMVFDRLGLKMESQRAPVERYIIDSVERPIAN